MITIPNANNLVYGLSLDWKLVTIVNSILFMARYRQAMFIPAGSLSNYLCALFFSLAGSSWSSSPGTLFTARPTHCLVTETRT